jgi:hypothetical protein
MAPPSLPTTAAAPTAVRVRTCTHHARSLTLTVCGMRVWRGRAVTDDGSATATALLLGTTAGTALRAADGHVLSGGPGTHGGGGSDTDVSDGDGHSTSDAGTGASTAQSAAFAARADIFVQWDSKACTVRRRAPSPHDCTVGTHAEGWLQLSRLQPAAHADVAWTVSLLGADGLPASLVVAVSVIRPPTPVRAVCRGTHSDCAVW